MEYVENLLGRKPSSSRGPEEVISSNYGSDEREEGDLDSD